MELLQFEKEYLVHVYETGPDGKLNLCTLSDYMQDIASDHAIKLGFGRDDLMKDNRFWVLSRMYTEINHWPLWGETVLLRTWPNGTDKLFALRNYDVEYPDGRHIASGSSSWLILDQSTKKIQRPDSILSRFYSDPIPNDSPVRYGSKIEPSAEEGELSPIFKVKISDLDVNFHTNNVRYLNWVYDTYSLDFIMKNSPQSTEINYLSEAVFDDEIIIRSSRTTENGLFFNHSVFRNNDKKELCRIRIGWKESNFK